MGLWWRWVLVAGHMLLLLLLLLSAAVGAAVVLCACVCVHPCTSPLNLCMEVDEVLSRDSSFARS